MFTVILPVTYVVSNPLLETAESCSIKNGVPCAVTFWTLYLNWLTITWVIMILSYVHVMQFKRPVMLANERIICSRLHLISSPAESCEKKNLYTKFALCQNTITITIGGHYGLVNIVLCTVGPMGPFACQWTKIIMHLPLAIWGGDIMVHCSASINEHLLIYQLGNKCWFRLKRALNLSQSVDLFNQFKRLTEVNIVHDWGTLSQSEASVKIQDGGARRGHAG